MLPEEEFYEQHLDRLDQALIREGGKRDNTALLVASGTLTFFVTTIFPFSKDHVLLAVNSLFWAWFFLISSIILILFSYIFIEKSLKRRADNLIEWYRSGMKERFSEIPNVWEEIASWCNALYIVSLLVGLVFLFYFAYSNISP